MYMYVHACTLYMYSVLLYLLERPEWRRTLISRTLWVDPCRTSPAGTSVWSTNRWRSYPAVWGRGKTSSSTLPGSFPSTWSRRPLLVRRTLPLDPWWLYVCWPDCSGPPVSTCWTSPSPVPVLCSYSIEEYVQCTSSTYLLHIRLEVIYMYMYMYVLYCCIMTCTHIIMYMYSVHCTIRS